jgi:hypothetical protein
MGVFALLINIVIHTRPTLRKQEEKNSPARKEAHGRQAGPHGTLKESTASQLLNQYQAE